LFLAGHPAFSQTPNRPSGSVTAPPTWSSHPALTAGAPAQVPSPTPALSQVAWRESAPVAPREVSPYHQTNWSNSPPTAPRTQPFVPPAGPTSAKPRPATQKQRPLVVAVELPPAVPPFGDIRGTPVLKPQPPTEIQLATDKYRVKPDDGAERFYTDLPGLQRVTRLESEDTLKQRMIQEARSRGERLVFPEDPPPSKLIVVSRRWPALRETAEPYFVIHGRLLWDQPNFDRHGWDLGVVQPLVSTAIFWWDTFLLPYNWGTHPFQRYDASTGQCLPGDPVPLVLPPPELRLSGLAAQAGALTGLFLAFP
jgi:hypothetical protein